MCQNVLTWLDAKGISLYWLETRQCIYNKYYYLLICFLICEILWLVIKGFPVFFFLFTRKWKWNKDCGRKFCLFSIRICFINLKCEKGPHIPQNKTKTPYYLIDQNKNKWIHILELTLYIKRIGRQIIIYKKTYKQSTYNALIINLKWHQSFILLSLIYSAVFCWF